MGWIFLYIHVKAFVFFLFLSLFLSEYVLVVKCFFDTKRRSWKNESTLLEEEEEEEKNGKKKKKNLPDDFKVDDDFVWHF